MPWDGDRRDFVQGKVEELCRRCYEGKGDDRAGRVMDLAGGADGRREDGISTVCSLDCRCEGCRRIWGEEEGELKIVGGSFSDGVPVWEENKGEDGGDQMTALMF